MGGTNHEAQRAPMAQRPGESIGPGREQTGRRPPARDPSPHRARPSRPARATADWPSHDRSAPCSAIFRQVGRQKFERPEPIRRRIVTRQRRHRGIHLKPQSDDARHAMRKAQQRSTRPSAPLKHPLPRPRRNAGRQQHGLDPGAMTLRPLCVPHLSVEQEAHGAGASTPASRSTRNAAAASSPATTRRRGSCPDAALHRRGVAIEHEALDPRIAQQRCQEGQADRVVGEGDDAHRRTMTAARPPRNWITPGRHIARDRHFPTRLDPVPPADTLRRTRSLRVSQSGEDFGRRRQPATRRAAGRCSGSSA
jgi:hypothetical protein